jgi:hypothetical protein
MKLKIRIYWGYRRKETQCALNLSAAITKESPSVLDRTTVLRRKVLDVDERQELLADRARALPDDLHLGERCGGQDGLEEPKDPRHE